MIDKGEYIKLQQRERARKRDESLAQKGSWEHATSCNIKKKKTARLFLSFEQLFELFPTYFRTNFTHIREFHFIYKQS